MALYLILAIMAFSGWAVLLGVTVYKNLDSLNAFTLLLLLPIIAGVLLRLSGIEHNAFEYFAPHMDVLLLCMLMTGLFLAFLQSRLNTLFAGAIYGFSALIFMRFLTAILISL